MDQGLILEPKWQAILANEMYCGHIVCNPQTPCKTKVILGTSRDFGINAFEVEALECVGSTSQTE